MILSILAFRWKEYSVASVDSVGDILRHIACGAKHAGKQSSLFTRMAVLEARAAKRFKIGIVAFFPFMFFVFGLVMGKFCNSSLHFILHLLNTLQVPATFKFIKLF